MSKRRGLPDEIAVEVGPGYTVGDATADLVFHYYRSVSAARDAAYLDSSGVVAWAQCLLAEHVDAMPPHLADLLEVFLSELTGSSSLDGAPEHKDELVSLSAVRAAWNAVDGAFPATELRAVHPGGEGDGELVISRGWSGDVSVAVSWSEGDGTEYRVVAWTDVEELVSVQATEYTSPGPTDLDPTDLGPTDTGPTDLDPTGLRSREVSEADGRGLLFLDALEVMGEVVEDACDEDTWEVSGWGVASSGGPDINSDQQDKLHLDAGRGDVAPRTAEEPGNLKSTRSSRGALRPLPHEAAHEANRGKSRKQQAPIPRVTIVPLPTEQPHEEPHGDLPADNGEAALLSYADAEKRFYEELGARRETQEHAPYTEGNEALLAACRVARAVLGEPPEPRVLHRSFWLAWCEAMRERGIDAANTPVDAATHDEVFRAAWKRVENAHPDEKLRVSVPSFQGAADAGGARHYQARRDWVGAVELAVYWFDSPGPDNNDRGPEPPSEPPSEEHTLSVRVDDAGDAVVRVEEPHPLVGCAVTTGEPGNDEGGSGGSVLTSFDRVVYDDGDARGYLATVSDELVLDIVTAHSFRAWKRVEKPGNRTSERRTGEW